MLANNEDPDQTPLYVASDLGLHCLPMRPFYGFPGKNGLNRNMTVHGCLRTTSMYFKVYTGLSRTNDFEHCQV